MTLVSPHPKSPKTPARTKTAARNPAAAQLNKPDSCPIGADVDKVVEASGTLGQSLRRLRRDLQNCQACTEGADCARWTEWQTTITQALSEVSQEWQPQ
jgi:hypothetical protein